MDLILPYKVGDLAEAKSFVEGYRGAWFRCKIHDMRVTDTGHFECYLEYIDYIEETKEWIRLFQNNPACSKQDSTENSQLMIRPSFPQWYWEDQVPEQFPNSDVIAIVYEAWKVGDLVDWSSEDCYWSGKITKLLDEDTVEVELLKPPIGEGGRYVANRNHLRPTLDWCLTKGWTVPLSKARRKTWYAARLIHHKSESDDEQKEGGVGGGHSDSEDGQQSVNRASSMPKEAPGSLIPEHPSATNSNSNVKTPKDAILTPMEDLEPSSTSKPPDPKHAAQVADTSSQPGAGIPIKQEPGIGISIKKEQGPCPSDHELDGAVKRLDEVKGKLEHLLELTRSERACKAAELASICQYLEEDSSVKLEIN
ncbi:hypothetical protein ACP70R_048317 [Stipagrostis hirtigluma subsp. patula]